MSELEFTIERCGVRFPLLKKKKIMASSQSVDADDTADIGSMFSSATPSEGTSEESSRSLGDSDDDAEVGPTVPTKTKKASRQGEFSVATQNARQHLKTRSEKELVAGDMRRRKH